MTEQNLPDQPGVAPTAPTAPTMPPVPEAWAAAQSPPQPGTVAPAWAAGHPGPASPSWPGPQSSWAGPQNAPGYQGAPGDQGVPGYQGAPGAGSWPDVGHSGWPQPAQAPASASSKAGTLSTLAMWIGVVALVASLIPVVGMIGVMIGAAALILGIIAALVERSRGRAIAGIVMGAIAVPLALAITLATGGVLASLLSGPTVQDEVAEASALLDEDEFADDKLLKVDFAEPVGETVDYTVHNTGDHATPAALFVVDAIDANDHVIASGWGESESLDVTGRGSIYESYVEFDADVTRAASFEIRDLDASNALSDTWWNGWDATIEA